MSAALIARLIEAGTPAALVGEVAMELARASAALETLNSRRAKDRERKRNNSVDSAESLEGAESVETAPSLSPAPFFPPDPQTNPTPMPTPMCDAGARPKFPAPEGVSASQWKAFRQQRKKALNERSYAMICKKLLEFAEDGYPPGEVVDHATERGWETVFKPKDSHDRTNQHHPHLGKTSAALIGLGGVRDNRPM